MKGIKFIALALVLMITVFSLPAFAEGESGIDESGIKFIKILFDNVIKNIIAIVGAGFLLSGAMQVIEGTNQENAAAKVQGWKALGAGAGVMLLAFIGVPALRDYVLELLGGSTGGSTTGMLIENSLANMSNVLPSLF